MGGRLLYGLLLYAAMTFEGVPLSATEMGGVRDMSSFFLALLPQIVLLGWPFALSARFALIIGNQ